MFLGIDGERPVMADNDTITCDVHGPQQTRRVCGPILDGCAAESGLGSLRLSSPTIVGLMHGVINANNGFKTRGANGKANRKRKPKSKSFAVPAMTERESLT